MKKELHSNGFVFIAMMFVAVLIISNISAAKIISIGGLNLDWGNFLFPLSYIFWDVMTEVYGYGASRKIIWGGFIALILMSASFYIVQILPSASFWTNQSAFESILWLVPRITLGSILGYFSWEFCNSYVLSKMKIWTKWKHLWTRTIGSTIAGEGVDTIIFMLVAFYGAFPAGELLAMSITTYFVKVGIEIICTPITYIIVWKLKKLEGIDVFDTGVKYNPFHLS